MIKPEKLKVAFPSPASMASNQTLESYLESKYDPDFRIFRMISEGMKFDPEILTDDSTTSKLLPNGSWTGIIGKVNRSEVDMVTTLFMVSEERKKVIHFFYPFRFYASSFVIEKPEYSPQVFGIIKPFSLYAWLTLALFAIAMVVTKSILTKQKHSVPDVIFDIISVSLKQSMTMKPLNLSQTLLTYNWIVGTMFLGFCYSSVLLSFLTFPSVLKIRNMQDLAYAVENDGYNCMCDSYIGIGPTLMANSKLKPLAILGENMLSSPNGFGNFEDFLRMKAEKIAFFNLREAIPSLPNNFFVSGDNILESMAAMIVRKDFCCKEQLDGIIHRIMAAGLYAKVTQDRKFLSGLKFQHASSLAKSERKLTVKDLFLAFIILLFGHIVSCAILFVEVVLGSKKHCSRKERNRKKRTGDIP